jgi:hypothetical protein
MSRVVALSGGTLALVGCLLFASAGRLPDGALRALAQAGVGGDYVDGGVRIVPPSATSSSTDNNLSDEPGGPSKTDFEGDEVNPALATYGIDRDGNLFEVHSPHTEVPRLPGPTI